ncbi:hypothetical protein [Helicobacter sp. L8]|uniref:hypothetical protein n=1 Tax=Helicobacter sp. L8 TaxID=2316078 RepID=UPI000EB23D82|nr:hypothetical protein [Helicobacter sp. L8]
MKLAKFALTCDGEKITSLEQLKEHFNLLDVLEHYKTNTLWRWLRSRGYQNELEGVEAINATQDTEILKALCEVFGIEADLQMIQEVLENHKHMEEQEALQAESRAQKHALAPLSAQKALMALPPLITHSTPSAPNFKDYLKSYTALKNKLYNAQDLEEGKSVLRELIQDYTELLEMDKLNIVAVLSAEASLSPHSIKSLLWLCFLVHFWGLKWREGGFHIFENFDRNCYEIYFYDFAGFAQPQTLTVTRHWRGHVHVFEKMVCINPRYGTSQYDYKIAPYNLETGETERDSKLLDFWGNRHRFYLCRGAVQIYHDFHDRSGEKESTLSYIEIEP